MLGFIGSYGAGVLESLEGFIGFCGVLHRSFLIMSFGVRVVTL